MPCKQVIYLVPQKVPWLAALLVLLQRVTFEVSSRVSRSQLHGL